MYELLTVEEMAAADRRAVALGVPSLTLMENAGRAVAIEAAKMVPAGARIAVLCGPGNNGGDGFVAARYLRERGIDVRVACLVPVDQLKGDAAEMARRWLLPVHAASEDSLHSMDLVIDALFGAGLVRPIGGSAAELVSAMSAYGAPILSVDVPSGLNGTTGTHDGPVVRASRTITFFRKKPGHLLMPGRVLCGDVVVADIGIPEDVLGNPPPHRAEGAPSARRGEGLGVGGLPRAESFGQNDDIASPVSHKQQSAGVFTPPPSPPRQGEGSTTEPLSSSALRISTFENHPSLWLSQFPWPRLDAHKYARGHAVVVSGPAFQTGAARLAARGALRMGAGLVTVASPPSGLPENAVHLTAIMLKAIGDARDLAEILEDKRKNAVLIGPGAGVGEETRALVESALQSGARVVLDADALTSFAELAENGGGTTVPFGFTGAAIKHCATPAELFAAIRAKPDRTVVMTPHEGEFARIFPNVAPLESSKLDRAREAARLSGAIIVLKGSDTVIAAPDGRAAINTNAPPWLATAGSGDVLAGFITGLLAQGMPAFDAACAAVWLHGECANRIGVGLIAEDLAEVLAEVLDNLHHAAGRPHWDPEKPNGGIG